MTSRRPQKREESGRASGASQVLEAVQDDRLHSRALRPAREKRDADPQPLRVLVTGGGGFLGRAIIERLLARGAEVRSFSRGRHLELAALGVETLRGDLTDGAAIRSACRGCELVLHVAARAGIWGTFRDYYDPNVRGTENVIAACREHDVGRLVFTSSPSVVFAGDKLVNADESTPYSPRHRSYYGATKAIAEQRVLAASGPHLRTLALRPHLIWGPRDPHLMPRLVARAEVGKLWQVGPGDNEVDSTYIDNAADAHILAAEALATNPNAPGRAYFISNGEPRRLWELINQLLATAGVGPVTRRISRRRARVLGSALEFAHRALGIRSEPSMTRFLADQLATSHWFDISAAHRELGYTPRISIDEGLRQLEHWFHQGSGYRS